MLYKSRWLVLYWVMKGISTPRYGPDMALYVRGDMMPKSKPHSGKEDSRRITAAERRERVIEMRRAGYLYREIASEVGLTEARCNDIVKQYLQKMEDRCSELSEEIRQLEVERLDGLFRSAWEVAMGTSNGRLRALEMAVKIQERRAKLLGLDSPERQEIMGPNGGPVQMVKADLSMLSDEELARAQRYSEKVFGMSGEED
jgi:hypothetical protein